MSNSQQTLAQFKLLFQSQLSHLYDDRELQSLFQLLVQEVCNLSPAMQILEKAKVLDANQAEELNNALTQMKLGTPIQYVLGKAEFYGLSFRVTPAVLIPRPETEELVELIQQEQQNQQPFEQEHITLKILDIGTGSGCIPIALKTELPKAEVWSMDISEGALEIARENANLNKVEIKLVHDSILEPREDYPMFDVIVSNPPYIPHKDKQEMEGNVLDHEPHLALFVEDNDPLLFYRTIGEFALKHLNPGGKLYFEIHRDYHKENLELAKAQGFNNVEVLKDMNGNYRMLKASL